ncbi:TlpA family protein disulfide reductase [Actinophytocola sp. NPDC049390]|uniref:TlpA family protein disulfide reductase n=1 Tax=Actinophytocola sp. NPDC049390 TaxID=3363894 RepID=UPI00378D2406
MSRWARWMLVALVLVLAGVIALWPRTDEARDRGAALPSVPTRPAPDLAALRAAAALRPCPQPSPDASARGPLAGVTAICLGEGSAVDLGAVLAGRPALINVWASWCQPCREELPVLEAYATSSDAVAVLGVQVQSDPADGLDLLASLGVHFPSVHDGDGAVGKALQLPKYLPVSYVVRPDGTVHRVDPPKPFTSTDQVRAAVQRYLAGGQPDHGN